MQIKLADSLPGFPTPGVPRKRPMDLTVNHEKHIQFGQPAANPDRVGEDFASALNRALGDVESLDQQSRDLTSRAVYDPDSVEVHTVMIAAEKARFAINLTKTLADNVVRTFRDLSNPR